jgi:hypothetical protein
LLLGGLAKLAKGSGAACFELVAFEKLRLLNASFRPPTDCLG